MKYFITISLLAVLLIVGCGGNDQAIHVFKLELNENEKGADVLILTTRDLPPLERESDKYDIYYCWIDQPAPPGGYSIERRIELRGSAGGVKGLTHRTTGLTDIMGIEGNTYYGRGRVCAIAVSEERTLISNVVKVPNKPDAGDGK